MSDGVSIVAREIGKLLKGNVALSGLSGTFSAGQLHGLIGSDGAGKTTFLRILIGLLKPDQGDYVFHDQGKPVPFADIRPDMAYMPQSQSLYSDLSCSEHLDFFSDMYQLPKKIYHERRQRLLQMTRLEKFQDRPAGQLSGGMYKKLGLMCALLASPRVLLLDEPTNGVDPISRREFWDLLYQLREQNILILMTTAYMDEAERCDAVHIMEKGKILLEGEPRYLLQKEGVKNFEEWFLRR